MRQQKQTPLQDTSFNMKKTININKFLIPLFGCMIGLTGCSGIGILPGRPLRIQGESVITQVHLEGVSNWAQGPRPETSDLDEATREALEILWLQDARGEHASIPAFSRISWQLAAIGAPSELIEWAHKAALEEIKHARMCFALAEGYGGRTYYVQPIPEMFQGGLDLANDPIRVITTETIFDGCLMEGFFANVASVAATQCEEPATLAALKQIADEEKSHAAFSWAVLKWLLGQHPTKVKVIIQNAYHELENYNRPNAVGKEQKYKIDKANPKLLLKHGRLPDEQWQKIWNDHLRKTQQDIQELINMQS